MTSTPSHSAVRAAPPISPPHFPPPRSVKRLCSPPREEVMAAPSGRCTSHLPPSREVEESFFKSIRCDKVACIGAGYVGGPTMAMIAAMCPDLQVYVLDISESRIAAWNSANLPIYEPGLDEIVQRCRGRNLHFTTNVAQGIRDCDIIFVSVNTPTKKIGLGAGAAADLYAWEMAGRAIADSAESHKIIVEKSTVPVRTAEALAQVLEANEKNNVKFSILSNPEFMAEGSAMSDLATPERVLIGGAEHTPIGDFSIGVLVDIYARWVARENIITTNLWSSELSKLVANAFLAQRISSINAVAQLCEKTGADVTQVSYSIGKDSRIGSKFLQASVGFGGSCFQKDLLNLVYLCKSFNLPEAADYWNQVVLMNNHQKRSFSNRIIEAMFKTVNRKKIAVLGFAFKKDTGDTRETPAVDVCAHLMEDGAFLHVYDPKVSRAQALLEFADHGMSHSGKFDLEKQFITQTSVDEVVRDSHAIVVLTEWPEFRQYDYQCFHKTMKKPAFLFDGRNILDHNRLYNYGFEVHAIGKASLLHRKA
eukprot:GHVS01027016.1.p1 GENE.GHVS01027016.1~~GHVS01027016.1.p1  ORF type:complete len:536 (+),score=77.27 GHVS01027016.1:352-1959(+)